MKGIALLLFAVVVVLLLSTVLPEILKALDVRKAKALQARIDEDPTGIDKLWLYDGLDGHPIRVVVQYRGKEPQELSNLQGLAAVRYYDKLCRATPHAEHLEVL